jgi:TRAP-type uncharacterized transport system fused permease subunit
MNWLEVAEVTVTAAVGIAALAGGLQGWLLRKTAAVERWMLIAAGVLLVYPNATFDIIGVALVIAVVVMQKLRAARAAPA